MKYFKKVLVKIIVNVKKLLDFIQLNNKESVKKILHITEDNSQIEFCLISTNELTKYRATTFSTKEPETLRWIDEFGGKGVFYDIGANIGIYSLYHAARFPNIVYAFEPSIFNLKLLAKNINLNKMTDRIVIISNPIADDSAISDFNLSSIAEGSAHSTFKETWNQKGEKLEVNFSYKTLGFKLDDLIENNYLPAPSIVKIDVDGIEHLILQGSRALLAAPNLISVLVEVHPEFIELSQSVSKIMSEFNFRLDSQRSSFENQVWIKD
jgi:FkbM family methyltransferase